MPINLAIRECSACNQRARLRYADYRPQITALIVQGLSYGQVAARLRLRKGGVAGVCKRWGLPPKRRSAGQRRSRQPCGTEAAKYRHHRQQRYSWRDCPQCRFVPWRNRSKSTLKK